MFVNFIFAEKGSVEVFGDDKLAFKGQLVLFECQAAGWFPKPTLQWQVNDKKVSALSSDMLIIILLIFKLFYTVGLMISRTGLELDV